MDHLSGSKIGLIDYISNEPKQDAVEISTYGEHFVVFNLDAIKEGAKSEKIKLILQCQSKSNPTHTNYNNLSGEFAAQN